MGIRLKSEAELKDKFVPGPGKYDAGTAHKSLYDITPAWTMQPRPQTAFSKMDIPAPNRYYPKHNPKQKTPPCYSMGGRLIHGSPMDATGSKHTPGPGTYTLPTTLENRPITIKSRKDKKTIATTPGPNHYNPDRGARPASARAWTIGYTFS